MLIKTLKTQIGDTVHATWGNGLDITRLDVIRATDPAFGDFSTNAAMIFAKNLSRNPRDLADELATALKQTLPNLKEASVAGPGFVNLTLTSKAVAEGALVSTTDRPNIYRGMQVVTEYSDPNPFKVLHVGHLYTSVVGDAISKLIKVAGGTVHSVNFGGDVGLHVGKTLWAICRELGGEFPDKLKDIPAADRSTWMGKCYVTGTQSYEDDEEAKAEIIKINARVYSIHSENDHESPLAKVYWTCRSWSYDYFNAFYKRIGIEFERYYPESETTELGLRTVREQLAKGVYSESNGAIVFDGSRYGLHTRVFVTSRGLATYEAKDVGLIMTKWKDYAFDLSVVITGNDIIEYMKVVLKSIEQYAPELVERTRHMTHGNVKLAGKVKMSSRKGNFVLATDVLDIAAETNQRTNGRNDESVELGAVKYSFLKHRIGTDLVFTAEESVSLEGNSGPYIQYAHARARSLLAKVENTSSSELNSLDNAERILARKISDYPDVLDLAATELMPHHICTYLYELAQTFNRFYEVNRVVGDDREDTRVQLVVLYANVLRDGLQLLGIDAPERL